MRTKGVRLNFYHWCKTPSSTFSKKFQRRPQIFLHSFVRAPSDLQLCFVQLKTLAPSARYSTYKYRVTLKSWLGVTQGHQKLYHSIRHPWLPINIHSNHRPISHCFRDKRRYPSKIANFYHPPCIKRPRWRGFPWNWVSVQGISNASMTGLPDGWQIFKIGLVILIQYRLWQMDAHPATQPRCRSKDAAYYVVRVIKTKWAGLWAQTSIPKSWS